MRNALACLALALVFAALAVRPGAEESLLQEWQGGWDHLQWRKWRRRPSRRGVSSDEDYIRQLSRARWKQHRPFPSITEQLGAHPNCLLPTLHPGSAERQERCSLERRWCGGS